MRIACAAVLALAAAAPAAAAPPRLLPLPSALTPITASPPLTAATGIPLEVRFPGPIGSRQRVVAGIDSTGKPVSVEVTQRLEITGTGDYSFLIPAPLRDVRPAPGTQSEPGQRRNAILWQGFSPGRKVLAATAVLEPRPSGRTLPLAIELETRVAGAAIPVRGRRTGALAMTVRLRNRSRAATTTYSGRGVPLQVAGVLDAIHRSLRRGEIPPPQFARVVGPVNEWRLQVDAPLEVEGEVVFAPGSLRRARVVGGRVVDGRRVRFSALLEQGRGLAATVRVSGQAVRMPPPAVSVRARLVPPLWMVVPPDALSWRDAVRRSGRFDGQALVERAARVLLRTARVNQYGAFLANPYRGGENVAVYLYRSAPAPRVVARPPVDEEEGLGTLPIVLLAVGGAVAAGALAVVWAHS